MSITSLGQWQKSEHRFHGVLRLFALFILTTLLTAPLAIGQDFNPNDPFANEDGDINLGGDIFSDFHEDAEAAQEMETERFYRYGRFFSVQWSMGITNFGGNRGIAYQNSPPSYGLGVNYFSGFRSSFGLGFEFSRHHFFIDQPVNAYHEPLGAVDVKMLRFYFSHRHYLDTTNLGTSITYANPYFIGRMEYWYLTNKFRDQEDILPDDSGGSIGLGLGLGMEFPIVLRKSYLGVEFLWHTTNFHDKYTQDYRPLSKGSGFGYRDLTGSIYSLMASYVINW